MNGSPAPTLIFDTCAIQYLASALLAAHIPIESVVGNKKFPTVLITDTVGSESFGKDCFGGNAGIVAKADPKGYVDFKSWPEASKLLSRQRPPQDVLPHRFMEFAEGRYTLLNELAKQHKLMVVRTSVCQKKRHDSGKFSGYEHNAGEDSIAALFAMAHPLVKSHVAIVTSDRSCAFDIFSPRLYKEEEPLPPSDTIIMNVLKLGVALRGVNILNEEQFRAFKEQLHLRASVDLLENCKNDDPSLTKRLQLANTDASLKLFRWIKDAANGVANGNGHAAGATKSATQQSLAAGPRKPGIPAPLHDPSIPEPSRPRIFR